MSNDLLFFAGICVLAAVQFCLIAVILRSVRASIDKAVTGARADLKKAQDKVYADLAAWFIPAKEGELSRVDMMVDHVIETAVDDLFLKIKMSALGKAGGLAPDHDNPAGGQTGLSTGNTMLDLFINRFAPGLAQLSPGKGGGNNHDAGRSGGDFGSELAKFK